MTDRFVWDIAAADPEDSTRFGGKGAGLARMAALGIPVPPGFIIGTDAFRAYRTGGGTLPPMLRAEIDNALVRLEQTTGKSFGRDGAPLLVSVRSGAKVSMPGMMDTVLNLGLDAGGAVQFARAFCDVPFAIDTFMRFWRMFGEIVLGIDPHAFDEATVADRAAIKSVDDVEAFAALEKTVVEIARELGADVTTRPRAQLDQAICAVFDSWDSARAKAYRKHHAIADDLGTTVTVQAMVFGNMDRQSGSGVAFTRNPNTGERGLYGEYLIGRQGEDLVAGTHTPIELSDPGSADPALRRSLAQFGDTLEALYRDAVDIEFTVESSHLYLLQVRPAKRTAAAAIRIAIDLVDEGVLTARDAVKSVSAEQLRRLLRPVFDAEVLAGASPLAQGVGSSPGHATGDAALDSDRAALLAAGGRHVILLRPTTSPQDIHGMLVADGIVTARGGALSHAAVVSRALDKPCVVGCEAINVDLDTRTFVIDGQGFAEGEPLSIDGTAGKIYAGTIPLRAPLKDVGALRRLMAFADELSGAELWITAHSRAEASDAAALEPAGLGIVSLTDLMISTGRIDEFAAIVAEMGRGDQGPARQEQTTSIIFETCRDLFADHAHMRIDIRLPRVSSERARKLIESWTGLPPRLFLPLGVTSYYRPLVRGIAAAAKSAGHRGVTALIGGITDPVEFEKFLAEARETGAIRAGAVLQNVAALHAGVAMARENAALWVDLNEIIRTAHGFPAELLYASDVFEDYLSDGYLGRNPRAALNPLLLDMIVGLRKAADRHAGCRFAIDSGSASSLEIMAELFSVGYRAFSVPAGQCERFRLLFGQWAAEVDHGRQE
jgi:pyruvate, orthophosphate dikinase